MKHGLRDFLIMIAIAVVVFAGLRSAVQTFVILGPSMQPSFQQDQRLLVNKLVYKLHDPERGDVIIFRPPHNRQDSYIKRIIGLPGEKVEMRYGRVSIITEGGPTFELEEPYVEDAAKYSYLSVTIPPDSYFVLGDNRNNTNDSHNGWMASGDDIIGKAWISIWPPDSWGMAPIYRLLDGVASAAGE